MMTSSNLSDKKLFRGPDRVRDGLRFGLAKVWERLALLRRASVTKGTARAIRVWMADRAQVYRAQVS
jgi:hypothetical protein